MARRKTKKYNLFFYKEIVFSILAVLSVLGVFYEMFWTVDENTISRIYLFDIGVALLFLSDFVYYLLRSKHKKRYMHKNWYLLLASIPILESWAELLKGLRLLELVRIVRAGEHLSVSFKGVRAKKHKDA